MVRSTLRNRAFTLIELLIVITIIGILAVALIPRLTGGPARARDASRQGDLQQIATALEFYADDNGGYPLASSCVGETTFQAMIDNYLTTVPSDPSSLYWTGTGTPCSGSGTGETDYAYIALNTNSSNSFAEGYLLIADLENNDERGAGVYATGFSLTTTGSSATAASNLAANSVCTSTSACATGTDVITVIGR